MSFEANLIELDWSLKALDYAGMAVFAATGALAAARRKHDIVTFAFFAAITGVGGGTLRDLLIGAPVFWIKSWGYLAVCLISAVVVWLVAARRAWRPAALLWLDAAGMSAYAVIGAAKALSLAVPAPIAVLMGVLTASFGGIIRDALAEEPSVLLRCEIYITAALAGAAVFVLLDQLGVSGFWPAAAGVATGFGVRGGALRFGWAMPAFPGGRDPERPGDRDG